MASRIGGSVTVVDRADLQAGAQLAIERLFEPERRKGLRPWASAPQASAIRALCPLDERGLDSFFKGDPEPRATYSHKDDVSLANPFGPPALGWREVAETMARAASHYRDGRVTRFERVAEYTTPDRAYIVEIERSEAKVGGRDDISSVALRDSRPSVALDLSGSDHHLRPIRNEVSTGPLPLISTRPRGSKR
jgi:hypothetical protein